MKTAHVFFATRALLKAKTSRVDVTLPEIGVFSDKCLIPDYSRGNGNAKERIFDGCKKGGSRIFDGSERVDGCFPVRSVTVFRIFRDFSGISASSGLFCRFLRGEAA